MRYNTKEVGWSRGVREETKISIEAYSIYDEEKFAVSTKKSSVHANSTHAI
jgi:hypothetical protein